jgi:hypothetical protein
MPTWEEARPLRTAFLVAADGPRGWIERLAERDDVEVTTVAGDGDGPFDLTIACGWSSPWPLSGLPAGRLVLFLEDMEERRLDPRDDRVETIIDTYRLPVPVVVVADWMAEQLRVLRGDGAPPVHVIAPGVDKAMFTPVSDNDDEPLRIAVATADGGADEARAAAAAMREPSSLVALEDADVVLALPRVAGFPREALEGFHRGTTCVTTPVTGSEAYVRDGVNGLLTSWDDERGTSRLLDLLARDRALLRRLREGARATTRGWPSEEDAAAALSAVLHDVAAAPVEAV